MDNRGKDEKSVVMRTKKVSQMIRIAKIVGITLGAALAAILGLAVGFYNFTLNKRSRIHTTKLSKSDPNGDDNTVQFSGIGGTEEEQAWFTQKREDVYITADDGINLHAHLLKNETAEDQFVITCHGCMSRGGHMAGFAKHFYDLGFQVLVPDARAHGASEGDVMGMGWLDRKDILNWIGYILQKSPEAKIILHGVSMGGATVMMTAGEELPANVKAVVEDCGYSSVYDLYQYNIKKALKIPAVLFLNLASLVCKVKAGYDFKEASAVSQVKKSRVPILFIHGDMDSSVPREMLDKVYSAAGCEKELLLVKGADHAVSSAADPNLYWDTVNAFVQKYI